MQEMLGYTTASVDQYHAHFQHLGLPRLFAELICAMNTYTALVDHCMDPQVSYDFCLLADQRNIVHFTLLSLPHAAIEPDPNNPYYTPQPQDIVYETFRLATLIYGIGIILPLPAQSTPLTKLAELIHNILRIPNNLSLWSAPQAQVGLLWILTLGAIAATHTPRRSWYVDMLRRVVDHNRITSYDDLKRYLTLVVWQPSSCDKPGADLWADVEKSREYL